MPTEADMRMITWKEDDDMCHCFALADVDVDFWYRLDILLEVND